MKKVHFTHDVREEGWYISDPRCQKCRGGTEDVGRHLEFECIGRPINYMFWLGANG